VYNEYGVNTSGASSYNYYANHSYALLPAMCIA
jgi:hypothetical protein